MVTVSSPGKIHLIGEHAVVYGEPAIIAAIGKRVFVKAQRSRDISYIDKHFTETASHWSVEESLKAANTAFSLWESCREKGDFRELFSAMKSDSYSPYRKTIVGIVLQKLSISEGVSLEIWGDVPIGSGMGSSSALAVALTKAIADAYEKNISLEQVNSIAYEIEKMMHGSPSGGDNSACCYGGLLWFEKGSPPKIEPLRSVIPYRLENMVLIHTGNPQKSTGELVQHVRNLDPAYREPRVKALGKATNEMKDALVKKDFKKMQELINVAQNNLKELGVSTPRIDDIAKNVVKSGGAAKLCGAGGGGMMLCYHEEKGKLLKVLSDMNVNPMETEIASEGVRREHD